MPLPDSYPNFDSYDMTFIAAANIAAHARVTVNASGRVAVAAAADVGIGFMGPAGAVSGQPCHVRLLGRPAQAIALAALPAGARLWGIAGGKVDDADPGAARTVGISLQAALAADDIINILPNIDYVS